MKILLALLIAATADAPSGTPSGRPAAYATAQNALSRPDPAGLLEDQVRAILAQEHVNAAAVVLVSGDRDVFVRGFGRDASGQPVGDDTLFRLGATSELMVGLLAERLAHENDRFDSPLSRLLVKDDPVVNPFETGTPLTLAHLLEHTSGLEDALPAEDLELPPGKEPEALEDLAKLRPRVVRWRPGSRHSLSAIDTTLAALALQEFAGKPFFRNLAETVLAPLGMFNTTWVLTEDERARTVAMRRGRFLSDAMPRHWAARGLVSNAHDLALLLHMLCTRGRTSSAEFLSEKQLERVEHGLTQPLADKRATAGFGVSPIAADGFDGVQIRGRTEGTLSELTWFPEQGRGLAILVGDGGATTARALLSQTLRRALLSTAARPAPAQVVEVPSAELASKVGYWSPVSPGDRLVAPALRLFGNIELSLSADGKALVLGGLHGPKTRLAPAAGGVFSADGARPAYAFTQEGEHELLLTPTGAFQKRTLLESWWMHLRVLLVGLTLLAMASSLLFALSWVPRALFGSLKNAPDLRLRALPFLASLCAAELVVLFARSTQPLGERNLTSVLMWLLPLVWAALSLAGLLSAFRSVPQVGGRARRLVWMHSFFVSVLSCGFAGWVAWNGLLGLRLWSL